MSVSTSVTRFGEGRVAVLLAAFNGAEFLSAQLSTLAVQMVSQLDIWASDDGSIDNTKEILERAARSWSKGEFHVLDGPRRGFAENFRSLMTNPAISADYVAFCDQDDLWERDKLADALAWLRIQPPSQPALYCTRTRSITHDGREIGLSPLFSKQPSFRNALVQSIAGANTMVMNKAAWLVVQETARRTDFVSHDWWCYLIVTGTGGIVHYSPVPKISYRQHAGNLVGENNSWRARLSRILHLLQGRFMRWNELNLAGLAACDDLLTPEARETKRLFLGARSGRLPARLRALARSSVYRQTILGQAGLYLSCLLKRI